MNKVVQHFGKGEVVIPEGSHGDRVYQIVLGEVLICKKNPNGKVIPIAKLGAGEVFGEMYLFDNDGLRSASAIATEDLKVEVFFEDELQKELLKAPPEIRQMLTDFSKRLRNTTTYFAGQFKEKMIVVLPDGTMKVLDSH